MDGLWVHDDSLVDGDEGAVKRQLPDGTLTVGKMREETGKLVAFDSTTFHRVEPWKGHRWSLTAYVNRACRKLQIEAWERLSKLGFVLPSKASAPTPPKNDPDDVLTLFEFAESDKIKPKAVEPSLKSSQRQNPKEKHICPDERKSMCTAE